MVNAGGPWAAEVAHMAGIGEKDHACSTMRVELPVRPRLRSVFVLRCPTGPVSDCPMVIDGIAYWRRDSSDTFIAGCSPPKVRFFAPLILYFSFDPSFLQSIPPFPPSSPPYPLSCHFILPLSSSVLSIPLISFSIFLPLPFQHLDRDADGVELDVNHALFEEYVWPKMANRVPAFEALKVTFALKPC